jgi:hypothetical protein
MRPGADLSPQARARGRVAFAKEIAPELRWHLERFAQPGDDGLVFIGPKSARLRRSTFLPVVMPFTDVLGPRLFRRLLMGEPWPL